MKLGNSVGAHQPYETVARVLLDKRLKGIDSKARALARLKIADADWRAAGQAFR